jgi:hypothetical protein
VQHQRRQGEVVHPIDPACYLDLILIAPVDFDEHLDAERVRLHGDRVDEGKRLRDHEAARAGLLDRVADCVEPDGPDPGGMQT